MLFSLLLFSRSYLNVKQTHPIFVVLSVSCGCRLNNVSLTSIVRYLLQNYTSVYLLNRLWLSAASGSTRQSLPGLGFVQALIRDGHNLL